MIEGNILVGDGARFNEVAQQVSSDKKFVTVEVSGLGGNLAAALHIGTAIRDRGWGTFVPLNKECASACAYIWLAGTPRYSTSTSFIGFHAAYDARTMREKGAGNAVLGSYLTKLGFGYEAIAWMTSAGPTQMKYLLAEDAAKYGIVIDGFSALPSRADGWMEIPAPAVPPAPPPAPVQRCDALMQEAYSRALMGLASGNPAAINAGSQAIDALQRLQQMRGCQF